MYVVVILLLVIAGAFLFYQMNKKGGEQEPVTKTEPLRTAKGRSATVGYSAGEACTGRNGTG